MCVTALMNVATNVKSEIQSRRKRHFLIVSEKRFAVLSLSKFQSLVSLQKQNLYAKCLREADVTR